MCRFSVGRRFAGDRSAGRVVARRRALGPFDLASCKTLAQSSASSNDALQQWAISAIELSHWHCSRVLSGHVAI